MRGTYGAVTEQECRALQSHHQQLVGVPCHRVSPGGEEQQSLGGALWGKGYPQKLRGGEVGVFCGSRGKDTPVDAGKEVTELRGQEGAASPCCLQEKGDQHTRGDP